jgi:hypothetical protein
VHADTCGTRSNGVRLEMVGKSVNHIRHDCPIMFRIIKEGVFFKLCTINTGLRLV